MWKKISLIIILFFLFALLQGSFFAHFSLFGAIPNLTFILFFLIAFFEDESKIYSVVFWAALAGFLLDVSSYAYLGPSIVSLIFIGLLLKGVQPLLKNTEESRPFVYFLPLFVVFFLVYNLLMALYLRFLDPSKVVTSLGLWIVFSVIYNSLIASGLFYIYKKIMKFNVNDRQLKLFSR